MSKAIEVIVAPDGSISIDAVGFLGTDCEKATAFLEDALGVVVDRQRKPEYHSRRTVNRKQRIGR